MIRFVVFYIARTPGREIGAMTVRAGDEAAARAHCARRLVDAGVDFKITGVERWRP